MSAIQAILRGWWLFMAGQWDETGKIHKQPDLPAMRRDLFSTSISDERTRTTIRSVWDKYKLLLEAHGAVAWRGFEDWLNVEKSGLDGVSSHQNLPAAILETANPAKFPEEIRRMMNWDPDVPPQMEAALKLRGDFTR